MPSAAIEARVQISQTTGQRRGANSARSDQDGFSALVDNNLAEATYEPANLRGDRPARQDRGQDNQHGRIKRADGPDLLQEPLSALATNPLAQSSDKAAADDNAEAAAEIVAPTATIGVETDAGIVGTEAALGGAEQDHETSVSGTPQIAIAVQPSPTIGIEAGSSGRTDVAAIAATAAATSPSTTTPTGPAETAAAALARVALDTSNAAPPQPRAGSDQTLTPAITGSAEIVSATSGDGATGQSPLLPKDNPALVPKDNSAVAEAPVEATAPPVSGLSTAAKLPTTEGPVTAATTVETPNLAAEPAVKADIAAGPLPKGVGAPQIDGRVSQQVAATLSQTSISSGDPKPGAKTDKKIKLHDTVAVASSGPVANESTKKATAIEAADNVEAATGAPPFDTPITEPGHPAAGKSSPEVAATTPAPILSDQPQQTGFGGTHNQMTVAPSGAVSQLTAVLANTTPVPIHGLAVEIAANAQIGRSRFEIRLDPPELGRIDVRLDVDRQGQVTSHLIVEKSGTLDLLRRDAQQLERALQDAGLKTSDNSLQFSLRDQSQSGRNSDNSREQAAQRLIVVDEDTVAAENAGRSYGRMLGQHGGVDIRV